MVLPQMTHGDYALVVETDLARAGVVRASVASVGMRSACVRDVGAALAVIDREGPPRISILSLSVAGGDALDIIERVRSLRDAESSPVIVSAPPLSADASDALFSLGVFGFVRPNAGPEDVVTAIDEALSPMLLRFADVTTEVPALNLGPGSPRDEDRRRLRALSALGVSPLAAEASPALSALVAEMATTAQMSGATLAILLRNRQRVLASFGSGEPSRVTVSASVRFTTDVVASAGPLIVSNASRHPRYRTDPQVLCGDIGAFVGIPVRSRRGLSIGAVTVFDPHARPIPVPVVDRLSVLARRVSAELENLSPHRASDPEAAPTGLLKHILDGIDDGILAFDEASRCVLATRAIETLFGAPFRTLVGLTFSEVMSRLAPASADPEHFAIAVAADHDGPYVYEEKIRLEHPLRRTVVWRARPLQIGGQTHELISISDVTEYEEALKERARLARTDHLTKLGNRRAAEDALKREHARAERGAKVSVVMFDLDRFKQLNDSLGHEMGDRVLKQVARALRVSARGSDVVFRWGGEEFLAILPDVDELGAKAFAERVRVRVEGLSVPGVDRRITISAGVTRLDPNRPPSASVASADENLYRAKAEGRNRVAYY
ncbi:MAG: diguanylate cyclase [Deltaproteobacteria bacterium]|nr:diguanylate cyclase [Deltaproteobacteria bacterium]